MSVDNLARDQIRARFGIPVEKGMRITFDGHPGVITGFNFLSLRVTLDYGNGAAGHTLIHPTWRVAYPELGIEASA